MTLVSEIGVMKYMLERGEVINSRKMATKFGCSVYQVSTVMKALKARGVVTHIRPRKWSVDRDKLVDEINAGSARKLVVIKGRLLNMKCEMCFNEDYWSEVVDDDGNVRGEVVECHHCGHKQKRR